MRAIMRRKLTSKACFGDPSVRKMMNEDSPSKKKKGKRTLAVRKGMKFKYEDGNTYTVQAVNATKGEVLAGDLLFPTRQ